MKVQSTIHFLKSLSEQCDGNFDEGSIFGSLRSVLLTDGFELVSTVRNVSTNRFLRGLEEVESPSNPDFILNLVCILLCIVVAGLASGLTQGLLSLDYMEMTIKSRSGTPEEKKYASQLIPVITRHHLLLVTLMLWNASATEALPIFLSKVVPEYLAIVISVSLVVIVCEIIPAAILTGPNQLQIAARLIPLVWGAIVLFFPVAWPIAQLLDYIIGHDSPMTMYNRGEIRTMMTLQHEEAVKRQSVLGLPAESVDAVNQEEVAIIGGALKFREIMVSEVMTPVAEAYMIPATEKLSYKTLYEIFKSGYSRIPVYDTDRNDIIGLILAKDLIFVDAEDETPVRNFINLFGRKPAVAWHDDKLGETLTLFRQQRAHMAIVRDVVNDEEDADKDPVYVVVGIITLEDIIEEILGAPVGDETDGDDANGTDWDGGLATQFRDLDYLRLKLLHNKTTPDEQLSNDEVRAVVAHLNANVSQIQFLFAGDMAGLTDLVRNSSVLKMKRQTPKGALKPLQEDMLYRRGRMSNTCTLVLSGVLTVLAGKDEFQSEKGPWSTLGADALVSVEGTYIPDYTAFISSDTVRVLSISIQTTLQPALTVDTAATFRDSDLQEGDWRRPAAAQTPTFVGAHSLTERKQRRNDPQFNFGGRISFSAANNSRGTSRGNSFAVQRRARNSRDSRDSQEKTGTDTNYADRMDTDPSAQIALTPVGSLSGTGADRSLPLSVSLLSNVQEEQQKTSEGTVGADDVFNPIARASSVHFNTVARPSAVSPTLKTPLLSGQTNEENESGGRINRGKH